MAKYIPHQKIVSKMPNDLQCAGTRFLSALNEYELGHAVL